MGNAPVNNHTTLTSGRLKLQSGPPTNAQYWVKNCVFDQNPLIHESYQIGDQIYRFTLDPYSGDGDAAYVLLDVNGLPDEGDTMVLDGRTYTFTASLAHVQATSTLHWDNTGSIINTDTVTVDSNTYTFVTSLSDTKATGRFTVSGGGPSDGNRVRIGTQDYTFRDTLSGSAFEVLIDDTNSHSVDNLIAAIMAGAGVGVKYGTGTTANADVTAVKNSTDKCDLTAKTAGPNVALAEFSICFAVSGANMSGGSSTPYQILRNASVATCLDRLVAAINAGSGQGTTYSQATTALSSVSAARSGTYDVVILAAAYGTAGNSIVTTQAIAGGTVLWPAGHLQGGFDTATDDAILFATDAATVTTNIVRAINHTGTGGIEYSTGTLINTEFSASAISSTVIQFYTKSTGNDQNGIECTLTSTNLAFESQTDLDSAPTDVFTAFGEDAAQFGDVLLGDTLEDSLINLADTINRETDNEEAFDPSVTTDPNAFVYAWVGEDNASVVCGALDSGASHNFDVDAFSGDDENRAPTGSWVTVYEGLNGTVGRVNELRADDDNLYLCTDVNTITDSNWNKVPITWLDSRDKELAGPFLVDLIDLPCCESGNAVTSLAFSADNMFLIVGIPSGASNEGVVLVYLFDGSSSFDLLQTFYGDTDENMGQSVAISRDALTIVAGAPGADSSLGGFYTFTFDWCCGEYVQSSLIQGTDGSGGSEQQGWSVSLSGAGRVTIVGAPGLCMGGGFYSFVDGVQVGGANQPDDVNNDASAGWSTSIANNAKTVAIGCPNDNSGVGFVSIWKSCADDGDFSEQYYYLLPTDIRERDSPAVGAVALSGDELTLAVGETSGIGGIHIYTRTRPEGIDWIQQAKLIGNGFSSFPAVGSQLMLSYDGNLCVASGPGDSSCWAFQRKPSTGVWNQVGEKLNLDLGDDEGQAVAISPHGDVIATAGGGVLAFWILLDEEFLEDL